MPTWNESVRDHRYLFLQLCAMKGLELSASTIGMAIVIFSMMEAIYAQQTLA